MTEDCEALVRRWVRTFGETPVLIDAELMRRLLAEAETSQTRNAT